MSSATAVPSPAINYWENWRKTEANVAETGKGYTEGLK